LLHVVKLKWGAKGGPSLKWGAHGPPGTPLAPPLVYRISIAISLTLYFPVQMGERCQFSQAANYILQHVKYKNV